MSVVIESLDANEDGTLTGVLERNGQRVQCDGIAWWDELLDAEMDALFDEWCTLAEIGEEGYVIL